MRREWLAAIRRKQGLTQSAVAGRVGISTPSYCTIETGKTNPRVATAMKIAGVLGFKWTRFFEDEKEDRSA